ncbi:hypothetical protein E2C01_033756 [Portunus trituberculatus]|uniref:Uncharacterized protein n=1 Tax=Portunus trituberculatus TaxID=210409 RepID=A0A5B7EYQ8_PORTR|nr:hypothetical protein [Portunus trituberculatus]
MLRNWPTLCHHLTDRHGSVARRHKTTTVGIVAVSFSHSLPDSLTMIIAPASSRAFHRRSRSPGKLTSMTLRLVQHPGIRTRSILPRGCISRVSTLSNGRD